MPAPASVSLSHAGPSPPFVPNVVPWPKPSSRSFFPILGQARAVPHLAPRSLWDAVPGGWLGWAILGMVAIPGRPAPQGKDVSFGLPPHLGKQQERRVWGTLPFRALLEGTENMSLLLGPFDHN